MVTRVKLTPVTKAKALQELQNAPLGHYYMPPVPETRRLAQSAKMWAMLHDVARQVRWPVEGDLEWIPAEDWKDLFTAALKKDAREAQGLYSGTVMLGLSTSNMTIPQMGELIELMYAWGANNNVRWSEPEETVPEQYR